MSTINRDDVVALLEDGRKSTGQLIVWLKRRRPLVRRTLQEMVREGLVVRAGDAWELVPDPTRVTPAPVLSSAADGDDVPPLLDEDAPDTEPADDGFSVDAVDEDLSPVDEFLEVIPRRPGRKPQLRQPAAATGERGPSWWVGLDRPALNAQAATRQADMSKSREARIVTGFRSDAATNRRLDILKEHHH